MIRVLVTGMGFALPGPGGSLLTNREEFWDVIRQAQICLPVDGLHYGFIPESDDALREQLIDVPASYSARYGQVQLLGLVSMQNALRDAGLPGHGEEFSRTAVLAARSSVAPVVDVFRDFDKADGNSIAPAESRELMMRMMLSGLMTDVVNVQTAALGSGGPSFSVSSGCASAGVLIGLALNLLRSGHADRAILTGADSVGRADVDHYQALARVAEQINHQTKFKDGPTQLLLHDQMRPYDARSNGFNAGIGAATLILETEKAAVAKGVEPALEILGQATVRSPMRSAVSLDESGEPLLRAVAQLLDDDTSLSQIDYINGGAQGDPIFNTFEFNAVRTLFEDRVAELPVTSQEACFGHNGAPLGITGAAATGLMMLHGEVAPTAGCVIPHEMCPFDPVPGTATIPRRIRKALSFNYQVGGVTSALLLGAV